MQHVAASNIPVVFHVEQVAKDQENKTIRQIALLFFSTLQGYERKAVPSEEDLKLPALIFHGFMHRPSDQLLDETETAREFLDHGIADIVLMNSAAHEQNQDHSKDDLVSKIGGKRFADYKIKAVEKGCSLENFSLFFINHAYCGSISSLLTNTEIKEN